MEYYKDEYYDLIKASQRGDVKAAGKLVEAHAQAVHDFLFHLCGNRHLTEDLAQDTFLRALTALKHYQFRAPLRAWLFRIAINLYRDQRRRKIVRNIVSSYHDNEQEAENIVSNTSVQTPHAELERKERFAHLYKAMQKLPESLRTVIIMRDLQELSYEEITQVLHWRLGTVKSRLFRARKELAELLSDFWEEK
ncbi:sigma-70 family RNA polymerase sigma factor [candidate division KSB1 bacterium]|nr:sigma-70 family RNA polymerase sigma factor [candidate division KSB1 bacterium]